VRIGTRTLAGLEQRLASSGGNFYWVPIAAAWIGQGDDHDHRWRDMEWLDDEDTLRRGADVAT
jgi:hypothetical protein